MDIFIALIIIFGVMVALCVAAIVLYKINKKKEEVQSSKSMPKGADTTDFARILQDKYKAERDSGEFKRPDFS